MQLPPPTPLPPLPAPSHPFPFPKLPMVHPYKEDLFYCVRIAFRNKQYLNNNAVLHLTDPLTGLTRLHHHCFCLPQLAAMVT